MLTDNFRHLLNKCNNNLFIDVEHRAYPFSYTEFPTGGLYFRHADGTIAFLMGVPHIDIPEYSIAAINFNELIKQDRFDKIKEIQDTGYALELERLIWRGWRAIVNNLINMKFFTKEKAERVFNTYFIPEKQQLPRTYINKDF